MAEPVIKWAGGKRQLLPRLLAAQPAAWQRYWEPFAGGAALFFALGRPDSMLSDTNADLMQMYQVVRDQLPDLIAQLTVFQTVYDAQEPANRAALFYTWRDQYNRRPADALTQSALFLALGRLAFNGLYRVNAQGRYNTPFGSPAHPDLVQADKLQAAAALFQKTTLLQGDYATVGSQAQPEDWIYCDPPYAPISPTARFTHYTAGGFDWSHQVALAAWLREQAARGVLVMASNADSPAIHDLYRGFWIQVVPVRRAINADATKRTGATEVILTSYPVAGAVRENP
ncbi:MAG: modification methylase [Sulfobacillus benefaciens]|uniref:Site-specific DNA-methyltransferase (adenine-specific) n=1 Tax=Sulfobacillus benefaciens TaxID=453960 RepID=A0A2T2WW97_9FIRM|nr:MAG: modification methylase [Sulfobacillus benefaciens]